MFIQIILPIILCFVPVILGFIVCTKFKINISLSLITILLGLIAVFPIELIQYAINESKLFNFILPYETAYYVINSLLLYGFLEETFKTLFISFIPSKNYSILQILLLGFLLGLSLASFENLVYFFEYQQKASNRGASLIYSMIFKRIFLTDILHMACAGLSALFIVTLKDKNLKARWGLFVTAILLHGFYDFFAGFKNNLNLFSILVVLLAILECRIKYKAITSPEDPTK